MQDITISSKTVRSREDLFKLIKDSLPLPDYCGNNLDALHDCLTDLKEDFAIRVIRDSALTKSLGAPLTEGLIAMLSDTADDNPHLKLSVRDRKRNPKLLKLVKKISHQRSIPMKQNKNNPDSSQLTANDLENVSGGINPFAGKDVLPIFKCTACGDTHITDELKEGDPCPCGKGTYHRVPTF